MRPERNRRISMQKRLQTLPRFKQHLYSTLLSLCFMATATGLSCLCHVTLGRNSANIPLVFAFFLILVSSSTTGYLYGIACSLYAVFYFRMMYLYPTTNTASPLCGYSTAFLFLASISIWISSMRIHMHTQSGLIEEREKQLAEAEIERMRANLLRAISHDLRTPLTGILGNSLVYLENQDKLSRTDQMNIVQNIYEDSNWLINMVENLLTVTRIRDEDMRINTSDESVEEVVGAAIQKMGKRHPECIIHARIPDDFIMLPMDAVLIEQVTINLLENAFLHSGNTSPIDFVVESDGPQVSFTVRDYGNGIPENMLGHLFDGSSYTASHSTDARKGMGIGLVICKTIVTAHHGSLLGRNHDCGAEFTFTLPKRKEESPPCA